LLRDKLSEIGTSPETGPSSPQSLQAKLKQASSNISFSNLH